MKDPRCPSRRFLVLELRLASRHGAGLREADRHMLDPGEQVRLEPFHFARQLDVLDPRQQRLQHQPQFEPSETALRFVSSPPRM